MTKNRFFIFLIFTFLYVSLFADERQHLVKPGDTLYSLAKRYETTVEAIQAANPSIEGTNIKTGMMILIPEEEKVKTSFISKLFKKKEKKEKYNEEIVAQEDTVVVEAQPVVEEEEPRLRPRQKQRGVPDNIVVILPFNLNAQTATDDRQQMRSVEFYEGFLLAVKEAEENYAQRILVQSYDLGTKSMNEILETQSLMDADLIIAPMDATDVAPIAEFGKVNDINVVSPFAFNQKLTEDNGNLVQINSQKSLLYDNLTADLLTRFEDYDFVFLTDSGYVSKADPYATVLRNELKSRGRQYYDYTYGNPEPLARVDSLLDIVGHNILYVPVSNTKEALQKMFPCLQCTTFDPEIGTLTKGQTAILGYPEWVLYSADFMDYYYDMNVYMFSKFYVNPFDEEVRKFFNEFRYWYAKEPMPLTPRYALLGFDVGRFFLSALRSYGRDFNKHLSGFSCRTLQSAMSFEHDGEGLNNKGLYLINFTPQTTIERYEIK